jgi:hypothetical protein
MNLQELITEGEKLKQNSWKIKLGRKKTVSGYKKAYIIETPGNSFFDWQRNISVYINRRFGLYSKYNKKLGVISKKSSYNKLDFVLDLYASSQYKFKDGSWRSVTPTTLNFPSKTLASKRMAYLRSTFNDYVSEYLAVLQVIQKNSLIAKRVYNFGSVVDAVNFIINTKNLSSEIKSKTCGNLLSQAIVSRLWSLCKKVGIKYQQKNDDIDDIARLFHGARVNIKYKRFFKANYTKFSRANRVRNQSCHAYEKAASLTEIKLLTELFKEVNKL